METIESRYISMGGTLIELLAAGVVSYHVLWSLYLIAKDRSSDGARLVIARGVLAALSFSIAGTLLKTIALQSWAEIRMFAFVLLLRTVLKHVFEWEQNMILRRPAIPKNTSLSRGRAKT